MTTPDPQPSSPRIDAADSAPELKLMDWSQIVVSTGEEPEAAADRTRPSLEHPEPTDISELLPGETDSEPTARDYERAYNSDLTLDDQISQFLAAPWDEEPDEEYDPDREPVYNYVQLEQLKRSDPAR